MRRVLFRSVVFLLVVALGVFIYIQFKPHRNIAREDLIAVEADALFDEFISNESAANQKYLDKALAVHGTIREITKNQDGSQVIFLQSNDPFFGISCTMKVPTEKVQPGSSIVIKGFCNGYLSDVVLTGCEIGEQ